MTDELISRQDAVEEIRTYITKPNISDDESEIKGFNDGLELAISVLSVLPSAQPEIVRCKDCRYSDDYYNDGSCYCKHSNHGMLYIGTNWNWYCADGERRDDQRAENIVDNGKTD